MSEIYSITDLSREFDITPRTLRFYEEKGLLSPQREGQNRIYSTADRTRLKLILRGKRLGLTLDESRDIIDLYQPQTDNKKQLQTLLDKIQQKKSQLRQQQQDLELMMLDLTEAEQRCQSALSNTVKATA